MQVDTLTTDVQLKSGTARIRLCSGGHKKQLNLSIVSARLYFFFAEQFQVSR